MSGTQARRLCPDLVVAEPRFEAYVDGQPGGVRHLPRHHPAGRRASRSTRPSWTWAACAGWSATRRRSQRRCASRVARDVGLNITVGVARTKFLAKVASGVAKPDGLLVVAPGHELSFLHPLPVERLWGVGAVTAGKLHAVGLSTVGDVADAGESMLVSLLGRGAGHHLHRLAHNRDPRPVVVGRRRGSIGSQRALGRARRTADDIDIDRRRPGRPGDPADAGRAPHRPHGGAPAPLRRLHPGDPLPHAPRGHRSDGRRADRGAAAAGRRDADDPRTRADPARACRSATSTATARPSWSCRSTASPGSASISRWTTSGRSSAPRRSPGPCCWAATRGCRCRCCRTEPARPDPPGGTAAQAWYPVAQ